MVRKTESSKDGSYMVQVALSHRHKTCYIPTGVKVESLKNFRDGQVSRSPLAAEQNRKLREIMEMYQTVLDGVKWVDGYECLQLKKLLLRGGRSACQCTFDGISMKYVEELKEEGRENYAKLIERNSRYFCESFGEGMPMDAITTDIVSDYDRFLRRRKGLGDTTVSMMMSRTRTIVNRAAKKYGVKYDVHPFADYRIRASAVREIDLTMDNMRRILLFSSKDKGVTVARDLFMLSFYLGGMNLVDILSIEFGRLDSVSFVRRKVDGRMSGGQRTVLPILPEAREIIDKWMGGDGRLDFGYRFSYSNFYRFLTRRIDRMAELAGVTQKVVFYSARKTFAQFASELGVPDGVIDYCLGHSDRNRGIIRYYTKVRQRQAATALARTADYIACPEKYADYVEMRADIMMARF